MNSIVLAITGASGAVYGRRLLEVLVAAEVPVDLLISPAASLVMQHELNINVDLDQFVPESILASKRFGDVSPPTHLKDRITYHHYRQLTAPVASGSHLTAGMVICPCSSSTLGAIAHGTSTNLIHRAAEVHLKERRKLILVPRETPLSTIQLDNMSRAALAGAVVLPASPGFYHGATTIDDLVDFVVARICDQLGVPHELMRRWGDDPKQKECDREC